MAGTNQSATNMGPTKQGSTDPKRAEPDSATTPGRIGDGTSRDELLASLLAERDSSATGEFPPEWKRYDALHPGILEELQQLAAMASMANLCFQEPGGEPEAQVLHETTSPLHASLPRDFGDYRLLEVLGEGGMGVVYKARQHSLGRIIALKLIRKGLDARSSDLARFQSETRAIARLSHPNLVPLLEAGEQDGQPFLCMPFIEGETLAERLVRGPLKPREAVQLLAPVAQAISHAHKNGLVHRDLKPSNILIDRLGKPHVMDFGLAKSHPVKQENLAESAEKASDLSLTNTGAIVGTPAYMAPEQAFGFFGEAGPQSDLYSMGVILYEMLTGRPPFRAATPMATLLQILDQEAVQPRLLNRQVDPDLELICMKLLQKQSDLRYANGDDLGRDLEAWLAGQPISLRKAGFRGIWDLFSRVFRETHHAAILENWGKLWMVHSGMVLLICLLTWGLRAWDITNPAIYLSLWTGGWIVWGAIFWKLRTQGGPVLFIERQVAHIWVAAIMASVSIFLVELLLRLPVLSLSPLLAVVAGMIFFVKAGMLSGEFYIYSVLLFLTAIPMAIFPAFNQPIFGIVTALCFFIPGLKYHLQRMREQTRGSRALAGHSSNDK